MWLRTNGCPLCFRRGRVRSQKDRRGGQHGSTRRPKIGGTRGNERRWSAWRHSWINRWRRNVQESLPGQRWGHFFVLSYSSRSDRGSRQHDDLAFWKSACQIKHWRVRIVFNGRLHYSRVFREVFDVGIMVTETWLRDVCVDLQWFAVRLGSFWTECNISIIARTYQGRIGRLNGSFWRRSGSVEHVRVLKTRLRLGGLGRLGGICGIICPRCTARWAIVPGNFIIRWLFYTQRLSCKDNIWNSFLAPAWRNIGSGRWRARSRKVYIFGGVGVYIHPRFPWTTGHTTLEDNTIGIERFYLWNRKSNLSEGESAPVVNIEHPNKNFVDLWRDGKNAWQEGIRITKISLEGGVICCSWLPRITSRRKVKENNS